ncbi:autoinducer synthesis protein [Sinorhizobium meliloti]|uniref:acyl-homoserine-lactone synthase n=1 Tax=Rhizobium meliloti TaxID=382 RepID=UPI000413AB27|nr:acyl-homoserine-lactone synthase [Sinorhizobium meliloti]ARS65959.1 autoinducer synthesis protein [Sinorhizobium meliloti RU11/001]RVG84554.1 autoinducer synthesis protein [Sinorhizobium meliloti]RVH55810.1 autoinducer synthesis protein [Sinorhizobium meliloti]
MQIRTASAARYVEYQDLLKQTYRLRADELGARLEWSIAITEAGERDRYYHRNPTYILATFRRQKAVSWARLLSTVGPTMLERTLPQSLASGSLNPTDRMIERSRFCVDTLLGAGRGGSRLQPAKFTMFAGIIERSIVTGDEQIATATDLCFERIMNPAVWLMTRVGEPVANGNSIAIAGALPSDRASFDHFPQPGCRPIASGNGGHWVRSAA